MSLQNFEGAAKLGVAVHIHGINILMIMFCFFCQLISLLRIFNYVFKKTDRQAVGEINYSYLS